MEDLGQREQMEVIQLGHPREEDLEDQCPDQLLLEEIQ